MKSKDFVAIATKYAKEVAASKYECRNIKKAAQIYLDSFSDDSIYMDEDEGNRICKFAELLPHVKGKWAKVAGKKSLIKLEPVQVFVLVNIFGWKDKKTKLRRYQKATIFMPRKNAKSILASIIGLYMLALDAEPGAEVYSGASSQAQAWEAFKPAKLMAEKVHRFRKRFGLSVNAKSITDNHGSKFECLIGDPKDGSSPHCAIVDEYHEHKTNAVYETMLTGMGAREQPLLLVITTAGDDIGSPAYLHYQDVERGLHDESTRDPQQFTLLFGVDDEEDWKTEAGIRKANPMLGVSISEDYIKAQVESAKRSARLQAGVKTKHFNIWSNSAESWLNMEIWAAQADRSLKESDFYGLPYYSGLDLASKLDLASNVRIYKKEVGGKDHFYVFGNHYCPSDALDDNKKQNYVEWSSNGFLTATDGGSIDHMRIVEDAIEIERKSNSIEYLGYDRAQASMLLNAIEADGTIDYQRVFEVPQTTMYLSESMKWIEALVSEGRIHHDDNPCMNWMVSNVVCREDVKENIFPRKQRPESKIDGAVAMITAFAVYVVKGQDEQVDLDDFLGNPIIV